MKLAVLGGGAVGLLTAFYLSQAHTITVITRSQKQAEILNMHGITISKDGKEETRKVHAAHKSEEAFDLCLVTVKQNQLHSVRNTIETLNCDRFLFLQNGMGHLSFMGNISQSKEVYVGIVEHGVVKMDAAHIIHTGNGCVRWGAYSACDKYMLAKELAKTHESFPFVFSDNWRQILIEKLLINACINPMTALLNVKNGELLANPAYLAFMEQIFNEAVSVLQVHEVESFWKKVLAVCEKTAENTSSMRADLLNGRKTEIDAILGYLINEANAKGKVVPHLSFLFASIKAAEPS
ncbi:2-dehydropantoate 2-reductase [Bacillus gobiensis]|uniref:2-dehydropantoate 2-reductase n=1 Tax=Bacillus gobiensis TaxID=1441095 RepID=UPI003D207E5E